MKCPYATYCEMCGHKNEEICNTCTLMAKMGDCIADIDTSGMTGDINCIDCIYYNYGIRPTGSAPVAEWIKEKLRYVCRKILGWL